MMNREGAYVDNGHGDGLKPICGWCSTPFRDGNCGEFKNYPADGVIAVFFKCEEPECPSDKFDETVLHYVPLIVGGKQS